ncbi:MAG TPA: hypothetical protein VH062_07885 [Polyangiaceae bacterium]|jgi:hypothetical protein|nr:hypothetical protein [Polyangiaceae bacterium]
MLAACAYVGKSDQKQHALILLAIRRLRTTERLTLAAIRARLGQLREDELTAFATAGLAPGALADALGVKVVTALPGPFVGSPFIEGSDPGVMRLPRWTRTELALGLELHVRDDASATVMGLVARIREMAGAG